MEILRTEAIGLYERFGFRVVVAVHGDQEADEEFFLMRLDLGDPGATMP